MTSASSPVVSPLPFTVPRWLLLGGTALMLVLVPLLYALTSNVLCNVDAAVFGTAAKEVLEGARLYRDVLEWKPPLPTLAYTLPQLIAPRSFEAIAVAFGLFLVVQALVFARMARTVPAGAVAIVVFVTIYPLSFPDYAWFSSEHLSNLFIGIQLFIAWDIVRNGEIATRQALIAGVAGCLAFHCRQNAVLPSVIPAAALLMVPLSHRKRLAAWGWMVAGGLATTGALVLVMAFVGDLKGYFNYVFVFPGKVMGHDSLRTYNLLILLRQPLPILFVMLAFAAFSRPQRRLVALSAVTALVTCSLSPKGQHHYWANLFPFVALYIAMAVRVEGGVMPVAGRMACLLALIGSIGPGVSGFAVLFAGGNTAVLNKVAVRVDHLTGGAGTLFVVGPPEVSYVQFISRLRISSPFAHAWIIDQTRELIVPPDEIIRGYLASPPTVLVLSLPAIKAISEKSRAELSAEPSLVISKSLLEAGLYDFRESVGSYHILVRKDALPGSGGPTPPAALP